MRPDAYGIVTAYGSQHLARKAEQVPQGLRDIGSSKRTCPLCSKQMMKVRNHGMGEGTINFRFAIMGAGNIAGKFCDAVSRVEECEVAAVASKSMERAVDFSRRNNVPKAYDNYEEMLQKERPDCVYIATTPDSHYRLAKLCMKYKTPVLCEKAMFMNSADARDIFEESEKNRVFVMEAMWSRFLPAVQKAKNWIAEGKIGTANCLTIAVGTAFDKEKNKRNFDPKLGGGAAFDLTVYCYELATWFFGHEIEKTSISVIWDETGIDTSNHICLKYRDKAANLLASCVSVLDEKLTVSGTEGRIEIPHVHYGDEVFLFDRNGKTAEHFVDQETTNGFVYEIREVIKCIKESAVESKIVPHGETLRCAELFDRIYSEKKL